jgi:excisionase family DNA binding protein
MDITCIWAVDRCKLWTMSYTIKQAAELTGLSTKTLRRKIASGELVATKQKGKYGDEYIIEHIPRELLIRVYPSNGQSLANLPTSANEQSSIENSGQNVGQVSEQSVGLPPEQSLSQTIEHVHGQWPRPCYGHELRQGFDSDTTFHELMKLVGKLQEENASLHEKIGELNATIQILSGSRMLPMSMPSGRVQNGKSWLGKLAFWRRRSS